MTIANVSKSETMETAVIGSQIRSTLFDVLRGTGVASFSIKIRASQCQSVLLLIHLAQTESQLVEEVHDAFLFENVALLNPDIHAFTAL